MKFNLLKFIVGKDIYGHALGVNYNGEGTYKTRLGDLLTLATYTLILLNFVTISQEFINRTSQIESN